MPLFFAKKEVYIWLKEGKKTIDVRKGNPDRGSVAVFQSGTSCLLRLYIVKTETGQLEDVIRKDNFKQVIPTAKTLEDALNYLRQIYGAGDGIYTAYHLEHPKKP